MCQAFSCIVTKDKKVYWKFAVDSHDEIIKMFNLKDNTANQEQLQFTRVEISPKNKDYLKPKWQFKIDETITPEWFSPAHKQSCMSAHKEYTKQLYKILIRKPIIHPFKLRTKTKITEKHKLLLKEWASVRASVWASVGDSVRDSVGASVWASVWASVRASVRASVWDSVGAYTGSFFKLEKWKYTEKIKVKGYPFQSVVDLWEQGLVPSFDGTIWRLHSGKNAKIVFQISKEELQKIKED